MGLLGLGVAIVTMLVGFNKGAGMPECCKEKSVGGVSYVLLEETDTGRYGCKSNCVYEKVDSPGSRFCFKVGGLNVVCEDNDGAGLGILISGGFDTDTSVEVYSPGNNLHCVLPSIPVEMFGHTSDDLTL